VTWTHGWTGILIAFGLTAAGTLVGLVTGKATAGKIIAFPLIAIPIFLFDFVVLAFLGDWLKLYVFNTFPSAGAVLIPVISGAFLFLTGGFFGMAYGSGIPNPDHKRGTVLEAATARLRPKARRSNRLTLAGLSLDPADETKHFKLIGTTGTGKSTAIRELLAGALERGDRAVIADPDGSYLNRFYDP
jgi:hypothetical protein